MKKFFCQSFGLLLATLILVGCEEPAKPDAGKKTSTSGPSAAAKSSDKSTTEPKTPTADTTAPAAPKTSEAAPAEPKATATEPAPVTPPVSPAAGKSTDETPKPTPTATDEKKMSVTKAPYGKLDGKQIDEYTLTNSNGLKVKVINYGGIITAVEVPDRDGKIENVTLHCDSLDDYRKTDSNGNWVVPFFGATIGRYGNRIAKGKFTLDGKEYTLPINDTPNTLHGGKVGFDKVVWTAEPVESQGAVGVALTYVSPDDDQGYPGKLTTKVTYSLTDKNELKMDYEATTDKDTVVNLTNHCYWNLAGAGNGTILKDEVMINADKYLPVDNTLIPTGKLDPVKDTTYDFTALRTVDKDMKPFDLATKSGGYDHCWVLNRKGDGLELAAKVVEPTSGRVMEVYTTQPAIQFYVGNFLDGSIKAGGKSYPQHSALCLETQHYPDSPNQKDFPSTVLKPGETYKQSTVHKFTVQK
jgi:aldose 1-epimerase